MHESIVFLSPTPTCIAYHGAILLHDYCSVYESPPTPRVYATHHTILVIAAFCQGQPEHHPYICIYTYTCIYIYIRCPISFLYSSPTAALLAISPFTAPRVSPLLPSTIHIYIYLYTDIDRIVSVLPLSAVLGGAASDFPAYQIPAAAEAGAPLPSDVFSLCLLPGAAAQYLPRPLQPLMALDSPLADVFHASEVRPVDLVSRVSTAVAAVPKASFSPEERAVVDAGAVSVFGSMPSRMGAGGRGAGGGISGSGAEHPFLAGRRLEPLRSLPPSPLGASGKGLGKGKGGGHGVGSLRFVPGTHGAPLFRWSWGPGAASAPAQTTTQHPAPPRCQASGASSVDLVLTCEFAPTIPGAASAPAQPTAQHPPPPLASRCQASGASFIYLFL